MSDYLVAICLSKFDNVSPSPTPNAWFINAKCWTNPTTWSLWTGTFIIYLFRKNNKIGYVTTLKMMELKYIMLGMIWTTRSRLILNLVTLLTLILGRPNVKSLDCIREFIKKNLELMNEEMKTIFKLLFTGIWKNRDVIFLIFWHFIYLFSTIFAKS